MIHDTLKVLLGTASPIDDLIMRSALDAIELGAVFSDLAELHNYIGVTPQDTAVGNFYAYWNTPTLSWVLLEVKL